MRSKVSHHWIRLIISTVILAGITVGCSVRNNTATTRFYHNLTTRYNVYYNGNNAFNEAYEKQLEATSDNLAERISLEPITFQQSTEIKQRGGAFDGAIEKGQKAIRLHSIRSKPQKVDRKKRNTPFYRKREYNTFIYNAWLLVGKSQYHNGDFLDAMATFSYMGRLYREEPQIRDLARLWQVRCYTALGWGSDAEKLLAETRENSRIVSSNLYGKASAELAILQGRTNDAIPMLDKAIRKEPNKQAKIRLNYLKGQLALENNQTELARRAFQKVISSAPAFPVEVAARLNIVSIDATKNAKRAIHTLQGMAKKDRYETVCDKIGLALGRIHLTQSDTTAAIEAFQQGIEKSTEKGFEYAIANIELAQIYLARHNYVKASKALSAGVSSVGERYHSYTELKTLSEQLDELARHAQVVEEQDSLRYLASLPEKERFRIIDSAIVAYKKQIREEQRQQQLVAQQENQQAFNDQQDPRSTQPSLDQPQQIIDKSFYFYNNELIAQGKNQFNRLWGNRPLEDNWRRRNKRIDTSVGNSVLSENTLPNNTNTPPVPTDSINEQGKEAPPQETNDSQNPEKRAYYIANLPLTPEAIATSDGLIQNALEGMGTVLNEQMERFAEAVDVYESLLLRYPQYAERLSIYYKLFMIFQRIGNPSGANKWKQLMAQQFPESELSRVVQNPNYITTLKTQDSLENQQYENALQAYRSGNISETKTTTARVLRQNPLSPLRTKLLFLEAMAYVAEGNSEAFATNLRTILDEAPQSDIAELAEPILSDLAKGRKLIKDGYQEFDFDYLFFNESDSTATLQPFATISFGEKYNMLLLYPHEGASINELLFAIASFNFARFTEQNLAILRQQTPSYDLISITGLPNIRTARNYLKDAYSPDYGYMNLLSDNAWLLPISETNYKTLQSGRSLGEYINFLADSLVVYIPEASIPLEAIAQKANSETNIKQLAPSGETNAYNTPKATKQPVKNAPQKAPQLTNKQKPNKAFSKPDSVILPTNNLLQVDDTTVAHIAPELPPITTDTTKTKIIVPNDSIAPGTISLDDVMAKRKERLKQEQLRAKEEKRLKKEAEKKRREELQQRERERRLREQQRQKELRLREQQRKEQQQEKERKRREAERNRQR